MKHNLKTLQEYEMTPQLRNFFKEMVEELLQLKQTWTKKIVKGEHYDLALYFLKEILGETKLE